MAKFTRCPKCRCKDFQFRVLRSFTVTLDGSVPAPDGFGDKITTAQCAECDYLLTPKELELFGKLVTLEDL